MRNYKKDFPIFSQAIHGKPLVFLDSAASSQKPQCVIDALSHYYSHDHANVHRGVYELSQRATKQFENTRKQIQQFISAKNAHEIIFTRGSTDAINLVAHSFSQKYLKSGDDIILSEMEHHSNIVPWQMAAEKHGAHIKVIPVLDNGELDLAAYQALLSDKTKIVCIAHASNVLGTINPIKEITKRAHEKNIPVLVDGAQAFPHMPVDVNDLDCDFYVFSSHKAYGPTGVGVLYGKEKWLNAMPPYQGGGDMIEQVSFEKTTYNALPYKFEAGTPNIADVIAFGAAIQYLKNIGMQNIFEHEQQLLQIATKQLSSIPGLKIYGQSKNKLGVIAFTLPEIHPHDLGTILDHEGIAIRAGHHCAMPLMHRFNINACARVSFGIYNEAKDIEILMQGLQSAMRLFA